LRCAALPAQPHLDLGEAVQRAQEDLVIHALVVGEVAIGILRQFTVHASQATQEEKRKEKGDSQNLRQPQLPRRIPPQLHRRREQDQQIRLARHVVAQLRVNQVHVDLLLAHVALLRHLGERARQVDDRVAAVVLREEENGEVLAVGA
jgi:hypothetical protein